MVLKVSKHSMKLLKSHFKTKIALLIAFWAIFTCNKLDVEMRGTNIESISVKDQRLWNVQQNYR